MAAHAWTRLAGVHEAPFAAVSPAARRDLQRALVDRLADLVAHPLANLFAHERDVERIRARLDRAGPDYVSPVAEHASFCERMLTAGLAPLLEEHPVLGRLLGTTIVHWQDEVSELVARLHRDRDAIAEAYGISREARITRAEAGAGDPHRGGQRVCVLSFEDGSRLVYKPRDLRIEAGFQELLQCLNDALPDAGLRTATVLERDGYGYWEHVRHVPTRSPQELRRFYLNAGRLLALLYLTGATDCHHENLIACGDQPVLVDVETLFDGRLQPLDGQQMPGELLWKGLEGSVLGTGLLPYWVSLPGREGVDPSALGRAAAQATEPPTAGWHFPNSDDLLWGEQPARTAHPPCSPVGPGERAPLDLHLDALLDGFDEAYRALADEAVGRRVDAAIERFRGASRRVVMRPTRVYATLQRLATTPDALRHWFERALHLEHLARSHVLSADTSAARTILAAELAAMERLDVPVFEQRLGTTDLLLEDGTRLPGAIAVDGLDAARDRLAGLGPADLGRQRTLIAASVRTNAFRMTDDPRGPAGDSAGRALTSADAVRDELLSAAEVGADGALNWLTATAIGDATRIQLSMVSPGLYDGRAGIAAFLYAAGDHEAGRATIAPVLARLSDVAAERYLRHLGPGLLGAGGLLRFLLFMEQVAPEAEPWERFVDAVLDQLTVASIEREPAMDLLTGVAGLARPLGTIATRRTHRAAASARLLRAVGDRLVATRDRRTGGWPTAIGTGPLTGWSHGASGMAVALAEAHAVTGDARHLTAAEAALDYEAERFDPRARAWPDLRTGASDEPARPAFMRSWCHGSVGIALARMRLLRLLPGHARTADWRTDIELAIEGTLDADPMTIDNLCCGNIGRVAGIAWVGQACQRPDWVRRAVALQDAVVARTDRADPFPRFGLRGIGGLSAPGLMTGLAGVGLHLLRGGNAEWVEALMT